MYEAHVRTWGAANALDPDPCHRCGLRGHGLCLVCLMELYGRHVLYVEPACLGEFIRQIVTRKRRRK